MMVSVVGYLVIQSYRMEFKSHLGPYQNILPPACPFLFIEPPWVLKFCQPNELISSRPGVCAFLLAKEGTVENVPEQWVLAVAAWTPFFVACFLFFPSQIIGKEIVAEDLKSRPQIFGAVIGGKRAACRSLYL